MARLDDIAKHKTDTRIQELFAEMYAPDIQTYFQAVLSSIGVQQKDREDVYQIAIIKAYSKLADWTPTGRFSSWFNVIVTNTAKDTVRKQARKRESELSEETLDTIVANNNVRTTVGVLEVIEQVQANLAQTESRYAEPFYLLLQGHSYKEIDAWLQNEYGEKAPAAGKAIYATRQKVTHLKQQ